MMCGPTAADIQSKKKTAKIILLFVYDGKLTGYMIIFEYTNLTTLCLDAQIEIFVDGIVMITYTMVILRFRRDPNLFYVP